MLTEQELKQAVELAGGSFWIRDDGFMVTPWLVAAAHRHNWKQWRLDALAAQLVRQVDALEQVECGSFGGRQFEVWKTIHGRPVLGSTYGPDRTENTIRAILESNALEGEDDS